GASRRRSSRSRGCSIAGPISSRSRAPSGVRGSRRRRAQPTSRATPPISSGSKLLSPPGAFTATATGTWRRSTADHARYGHHAMSNDSRFAWAPTPEQAGSSRLRHFIDTLGGEDLDGVARIASEDPQRFWAAMVDDIGVDWTRRFDVAMDTSLGLPWTRFWRGGKLNLAHNAVTRWAQRAPDRIAVVSEGDDGGTREWTYADLERQTAYAASMLYNLGVRDGDGVGLCMPMIPETVALFLACAWLGAVAVPLFSGYGAGAIVSRLRDCDAKVLVIVDGFMRRGRAVSMKPVADEAAAQLPSLQHILVIPRLGASSVSMRPDRDVLYRPMPDGWSAGPPVADTDADSTF